LMVRRFGDPGFARVIEKYRHLHPNNIRSFP
jgi:hypothetical protein